MEQFSGCFTCQIISPDHPPCHNICGNISGSGCLDLHRTYECTKLHYKIGWMDWKKSFLWPKDISRCYFCGFPATTVNFGHRGDKRYPGICQFSDTAVVAAWHVLHNPQLFEKLQKELDFVPGVDTKSSFTI